jgi:hypothetical protein
MIAAHIQLSLFSVLASYWANSTVAVLSNEWLSPALD